MLRRPLVVLLVLLVSLAPLSAQQPYIESFEVRLHNLDVVVTDAAGNPVRGLTKDDFVVLENGVPQEVTNFSVYESGAATVVAGNEGVRPEAQAQAPPSRRFVFFIDEMPLQHAARESILKNTKQFVRAMRPGDVAMVVRPTGTDKILSELTSDAPSLEAALDRALRDSRVRFDAQLAQELRFLRQELTSASNGLHGDWAKRAYSDMVRRRVEQRLGQLRALVASMSRTEGRKVVVLITAALTAQPGREVFDFAERMNPAGEAGVDGMHGAWESVFDLTDSVGDLARTAAASGITIYAIEPDVPLTMLARGSVEQTGTSRNQRTAMQRAAAGEPLPSHMFDDLLHNSALTLTSLTEKTGGRWFRGLANIDDTFRQVSSDLSAYYSLAYRARGVVGPQRVEVQVKNRPELRVRTRSEVLEKSPEREMDDLVIASLLYPRQTNELSIDVSTGKPKRERGFYTIPLDIVIPMDKLAFLPGDDGKYVATFSVHYAAAGERRDFASGGEQRQHVEISAEQYNRMAGTNYRYKTGLQVAGGPTRIAIGVLDATSKLSGFETVDVKAE